MTAKNKKYQLKASSLFYALLVALVASMVSIGVISLVVSNKVLMNMDDQQFRLQQNAESGLHWLMANGHLSETAIYLSLFDGERDSVFLQQYLWGVYQVANSTAFSNSLSNNNRYTKSAFLGLRPDQHLQSALYLADKNKPLAICGNTRIEGMAYHPKAGVRSGSIAGLGYSGSQLVYGQMKPSQEHLPAFNKSVIQHQIKQFRRTKQPNDYRVIPDSLTHSFDEESIYITGKVLRIDKTILNGNIVLIADSLIVFTKDCQVNDLVAYAPHIAFEEGFQGTIQAFANKLLQTEEHCAFNYPSTLGLIKTEAGVEFSSLQIANNNIVNGLVFATNESGDNKAPNFRIKEETLINGTVFSFGKVWLSGDIHGHISCEGFLLQSGASSYENHLWNINIVAPKRSEYFLSSFIRHSDQQQKAILKWLP